MPNDFCKEILKYPNVKSYDFVREYFSDCDKLLFAIKEYKRVSKIKKNEYSLYDLIEWQVGLKIHIYMLHYIEIAIFVNLAAS